MRFWAKWGDDSGPVIERREVAQSEEDLAVVDGPAQVRPFKGVEEAPEALVFQAGGDVGIAPGGTHEDAQEETDVPLDPEACRRRGRRPARPPHALGQAR